MQSLLSTLLSAVIDGVVYHAAAPKIGDWGAALIGVVLFFVLGAIVRSVSPKG